MTTTLELDGAIEHFKAAEQALAEITRSAETLTSTRNELSATQTSVLDASDQLRRSSESWTALASGLADVTARVSEASVLLKDAQPEALRTEVESHGATLEELNKTVSEFDASLLRLQEEIATTTKTLNGGLAAATDQLAGLRTRMSDELSGVNSRLDRSTESISDLSRTVDAHADSATERHNTLGSRVDDIAENMGRSVKQARVGFTAVAILAGSSLVGTTYLVIQSFTG